MADDIEKTSDDDTLLATLKKWYAPDFEKFKEWWHGDGETDKGAEEDFRFRDGDQWSESDKQTLSDQDRPVLVFNRSGVLVDAVVGSEIGNRREVRYIPREMADAKPNELLSSAAEWFRDQCDAEDEESEAFKDTVTAGMGWTETRIDFDNNPEGEPIVDHFDPREARWEYCATKANLVDAKRRWRVRKMPLSEAKDLFPGFEDEEYNAAWAEEGNDQEPRRIEEGNRYNGEGHTKPSDRMVTIAGCQYVRKEAYYKALLLGPDGTQMVAELDKAKHDIAKSSGALISAVRLTRRTVYCCYAGAVILKQPHVTQTGDFTWHCITGLKDQKKGTFYGIIRRAKDPQRWANKWLSQMMHILNSQAKGGIMAEKGAFENQRQAEDSWAKTERITWLKSGALSGAAGKKIEAKPVAQFPAGFDRLLQYADEAIIKATGINMELLGMRDATQPGVLEYQRKQAGVTILATFFDSLRRYRKIQGRTMLSLIQKHLADGRLVRIVGEEQARYVPLTKEAVASKDYDVIVDDSPTSTNEKEKTWQLITQIMPWLKDMITPQMMLAMAEYSPLPTSLVEKIKASAKAGPQIPPEIQQAIAAGKETIAKLSQENQSLKMDQSAEQQKLTTQANLDQRKIELDAANKRRQMEIDAEYELTKLATDRYIKQLEIANRPPEKTESGETTEAPQIPQPDFAAILTELKDAFMSPVSLVRDANGRAAGIVRGVMQ